jgi:hypothetical protein
LPIIASQRLLTMSTMLQLSVHRSMVVFLGWFVFVGCAAVDGFRFLEMINAGPLRTTHRAIQELTQEETALLDQCFETADEVFGDNAALNTTLNVVYDYVFAELETCKSRDVVTEATSAEGFVCKIDAKAFEGGAPFDKAVSGCIEAGGVAVVVSAEVNCAGTSDAGTIKIGLEFLNFPDCAVSEEVEPACDPDLFKRDLENSLAASFADIPGASCTSSATVEIISGNGESGGGGGTETGSGGGTSSDRSASRGMGNTVISPFIVSAFVVTLLMVILG